MMIGTSTLLLAASLAVTAAPEAPTNHVPPSPAAAPANLRAVERLRANGLRADDPHLSDRLAELARAKRKAGTGPSRVRFDAANVTFPKALLYKYVGPIATAPATLPSGMGVTFSGLRLDGNRNDR